MLRSRSTSHPHGVSLAARARYRAKAPVRERHHQRLEPPTDVARAREWGIEELLVALLQRSEVTSEGRSIADGRALVERARADDPLLKHSWADLVDAKWVRTMGDGFIVGARPGHPPTDPTAQSLYRVVSELYRRTLGRPVQTSGALEIVERHQARFPATPALADLVARGMLEESEGGLRIRPASPDLAYFGASALARVWERDSVGPSAPADRLWWWRERAWIPHHLLFEQVIAEFGAEERQRFADAVWGATLAERDFVGWDDEDARVRARRAIERGDMNANDEGEPRIPPPTTVLDRLAWVDRPTYLEEPHSGRSYLLLLVRALLIDEQVRTACSVAAVDLPRALEASEDRPVLFDATRMFLSEHPEALVDVLLDARWAALALTIVANHGLFLPSAGGTGQSEDADELARRTDLWRDSIELAAVAWRRPQAGCPVAADVADVLVWINDRRDPPEYGPFARRLRDWPRIRAEMLLDQLATVSLAEWIAGQADELVARVRSRLRSSPTALTSGAFAVMCWFAGSAIGATDQRAGAARAVVEAYVSVLASKEHWGDDSFDSSVPWSALARFLRASDFGSWQQLLAARGATDDDDERGGAHRTRSHLRLLSWLVATWPTGGDSGQLPGELVGAFLELLKNNVARVFDGDVDTRVFAWARPLEPFAAAIGRAINALGDTARGTAMDVLLGAPLDARTLGRLTAELARADGRERLLARLRALPAFDPTKRLSFVELQETIDAFVEADRLDAAEGLLERINGSRLAPEWRFWQYALVLRLALERGRWDELSQPLPEDLRGSMDARNTREFYEGLACLSREPADPERAREIFERLLEREPSGSAYAVNLISATIQVVAQPRRGEPDVDRARLRDALEFAERTIEPLRPLSAESERVYQTIRLGVLAHLEDWNLVIAEHQRLPRELQQRLGHLAVAALSRLGNDSAARTLLDTLHGVLEPRVVADLERELGSRERASISGMASVVRRTLDDPVVLIRNALRQLPSLSPESQARAWSDDGEDVSAEGFVMAQIVEALREVAQLAPNLAHGGQTPEEDRLNELFIGLLNQRVCHLGWVATGQARRGYTATPSEFGRRGVGEADIELHGTSARLCLGEALILDGRNTTYTTRHLDKVFAYGLPDLEVSFVLVWIFGNADDVWNAFCEVAAGHQTPRFPVRGREAVPEIARRGVRAVRAEHAIEDGRSHRVYHLGVDLTQQHRRAAAGQSVPARDEVGVGPSRGE